jgi:hypothetical protein
MNTDELSGRELDAVVAEHVFGFVVAPRENARTREKDFVQLLRSDSPNPQWVRVAFYSGSMGAAINVEVALRERGWIRTEPHEHVAGETRVVLVHQGGRAVEAFGLLNVAFCRAALRAVRGDVTAC